MYVSVVFRAGKTGVRMMKMTSWNLTCLLLLFGFTRSNRAEGGLCDIENGRSTIAIDINKGRAKAISQLITPEELPIIGDPYKEIALNLLFSTGKPAFNLNGKHLQLLGPLERDEDNLSHIAFQITCTVRNTRKKRTIPIILRVSGSTEDTQNIISASNGTTVSEVADIGRKLKRTTVEQVVAPEPKSRDLMFVQSVYDLQLSEASAINSTVATIIALHPEKVPVAYSILNGDELKQFAVGHESGVISIKRKLDREVLSTYQLFIKAETSGGLTGTATVNINVTDVNDSSPEFVDLPYEFKVYEGEAYETVGSVHAVDLDKGINGQVSYSLPSGVPFFINEISGEIITTLPLDYETQKEHKLLVTAKDGAPDPLLSTATVTVFVQDVEDEDPVFNISEYKTTVPENLPGFTITRLQAEDPDTVKKITYVIKHGPTDLFTVDSQTGELRCIKGLDYEARRNYSITVGTAENKSNFPGSKVRITIQVEDRNDIPPEFTTVPKPVTLEDDLAIGTLVTRVSATDSDGTAPGNEVKYRLIGRRKAVQYFQIDPDLGLLSIKDDLGKETDTEYQVDIEAFDLGEPSLSSVTTLLVYVKHKTTPPPEMDLGFTDDSYYIQVPENATARQLIKTLEVLNGNSRKGKVVPWKCDIISGNSEDLFYTNITSDRNCEVRLKQGKLDRETTEEYELRVKLDAPSEFVDPQKFLTTLEIHVIDVNDNKPEFVFPSVGYKRRSLNVYYGAIPWYSGFGTYVLTVKAEDKDSGKFATIFYEIRPSDRGSEYFAIDDTTGIITTKEFENVDESQLPFMFYVVAKDNHLSPCCSNTNEVKVVVNLIDDIHRFILVVDAKRDIIKQFKSEIEEFLQEHSGLIVGIEKFTPKQFLNTNKSLVYDNSATDIWCYAIDPETERILDINQTKVQRSILDTSVRSNITYDVSEKVKATVSMIRVPYVETKQGTTTDTDPSEIFTYSIIGIVAFLLLVLGMTAVVRNFETRSKFKALNEQEQRIQRMVTNQIMEDPSQEPMNVEMTKETLHYGSEVASSFLWITMLNKPAGGGSHLLPLDTSVKNQELPQELVTCATIECNSDGNNNT